MKNLLTLSIVLCSLISNGQIDSIYHFRGIRLIKDTSTIHVDTTAFLSSLYTAGNFIDNNAYLYAIKIPAWNLRVFDKDNKIVASMDSSHILTVYDSLATIRAFIKGYGIEIKGYNKFNQSEQ